MSYQIHATKNLTVDQSVLDDLIRNNPDMADLDVEELADAVVDIPCVVDALEKAFASYPVEPCGSFLLDAIEESLYAHASCAVRQIDPAIGFDVVDSKTGKCVAHFALCDLLLSILESEREDERSVYRVGEYVEEALMQFVEKAEWRTARHRETNAPVAWFGIVGQAPVEQWVRTPRSIWQESEPWNIMEKLVSGSRVEQFLIWYIGECGRFVPDVDELLQDFPFDPNDF